MNQSQTYTASCFCGAVEFSLTGKPEAMAYCHCNSCRQWSAGQVNAFTLWQPDSMKITKGADNIGEFDKIAATENRVGPSQRRWCKTCGGHICIDHPSMGVVDVPAVLIEGLKFEPGFHVYYQDKVHRMQDGLPKFKDLPEAAGGSGEEVPE
jgi:hypothetical protein